MTHADLTTRRAAIEGAKQVLNDYARYLSPQAKNEIAELIAREQVRLGMDEGGPK